MVLSCVQLLLCVILSSAQHVSNAAAALQSGLTVSEMRPADMVRLSIMLRYAVQLSQVSRTFRRAAAWVPCLHTGLDMHKTELAMTGTAPAIRSFQVPLLLGWAEHVQAISISSEVYSVTGLPDFLLAATRLTRLEIHCKSQCSVGQADFLLSKCHFLTRLLLMGSVKPAVIPLSVTDLSAIFEDESDELLCEELDNFIFRAERLPLLHTLRLDMSWVSNLCLTCPILLHRLDTLCVRFALLSEVQQWNLGWACRQPCNRLEVELQIFDQNYAVNSDAAQMMRSLNLARLFVELHTSYDNELQDLWSEVTARESLYLFVANSKAFHASLCPLSTLPASSPETVIQFSSNCSGGQYVEWKALSGRAGSFKIILPPLVVLHVAMDDCPVPLQQPWQLVVTGGGSVQGLPASQPTSCVHFLQNAAARAAGWKDTSF